MILLEFLGDKFSYNVEISEMFGLIKESKNK